MVRTHGSSLGVFSFFCYATDRTLLKQRWSLVQTGLRTWWRLASFAIPLQMVAAGFSDIFEGKLTGTFWLASAGVVSKIGTGFSRLAEGMRLNRLKSGELRNRALKMAGQMGVTLDRVYMVPAGKGHLTNAYGMSNAIGLTDNLGKYLTKLQVNFIIAHELSHVKLKHGRKDLLFIIGIFSGMTLLFFRFSRYAFPLRIFAHFAVIFGPLCALYYISRRFEYSADRAAVEFTSEPEAAIQSLARLHRLEEVPTQHSKFSELFMTHPSLAHRVNAIARIGQVPAQQLRSILEDEGIREVPRQDWVAEPNGN